MTIDHRYADLDGVRLHYAVAGDGPLMMFLHGFPEFWYAWKDQLVEFGRDHRVVAPDMRGYNVSSKPPDVEQYAMKYLVGDVRALAAQLGDGRFTLVGHDWGGAVAWAFAIVYPALLDKLVIVNAPHPAIFARELRENPAQQKASEYMLAFRSTRAEEILSADNFAVLSRIVLGDLLAHSHATEDDHRAYLEAWSQPGALTGGLNYYRAARVGPPARDGSPASGTLGTAGAPAIVSVPTLVIWGEKDTALLQGNLEGLGQYVTQLTVRRVPDGTHWVVHEQPALVNRYIREFIS